MIGANLTPLREVYRVRATVKDPDERAALTRAWFALRIFAKLEAKDGFRDSARQTASTARDLIGRFGERIGGAQ